VGTSEVPPRAHTIFVLAPADLRRCGGDFIQPNGGAFRRDGTAIVHTEQGAGIFLGKCGADLALRGSIHPESAGFILHEFVSRREPGIFLRRSALVRGAASQTGGDPELKI
jgi:hypothetical protein